MLFAANRRNWGFGGRGGGAQVTSEYDFCGAATGLATSFALLLHVFSMHNVLGSW